MLVIVINNEQFKRLVEDLPILEGADIFRKALVDIYGIKEMKPHRLALYTDWDIYFIDDNAELIFKLKYGEYL